MLNTPAHRIHTFCGRKLLQATRSDKFRSCILLCKYLTKHDDIQFNNFMFPFEGPQDWLLSGVPALRSRECNDNPPAIGS